MALFATSNRLIGVKKESVSGVAETLTDADYNVRIREGDLSTLEVTYSDTSNILNGSFQKEISQAGIVRGAIDTMFLLAPGEYIATGTPGTPVWENRLPYGVYFESAGVKVDYIQPVDETAIGYVEIYPSSDSCSTITETVVDVSDSCSIGGVAGIEYKIKGGMSEITIDATAVGEPFSVNVNTQGGVASVEELTTIPVFDDDGSLSTNAPIFMNTVVRITEVNQDGTAIVPAVTPKEFCTDTFSFKFNNTVSEVLCGSSAYGVEKFVVTDRAPSLEISPLLEKISDWDFWGAMTTDKVYLVEVIGYNDPAHSEELFAITVFRAQMRDVSNSDSNGFRRLGTTFYALSNKAGATASEKERDFTLKIWCETIDKTA